MPNSDFSIDLHTHATYKPLGKSYPKNTGKQSASVSDKNSMWRYDPPSLTDKLLNDIGSLTKFSQTNFTAASYGNVWVMAIGMGSIEKWFFNNKLGKGFIADILEDFATELGKPRIDAVQNMNDCWSDLMQEFSFLRQMHNKPVIIDGHKYKYMIVNNFGELQNAIEENETVIEQENDQPLNIAIIPSIEGMHVLNCGLDPDRNSTNIKADAEEVKQHARDLKNQTHKPWVITFAHHFYNELCGQSLSLRGVIAKKCDQSVGLKTGFTDLGKDVLNILLDKAGLPAWSNICISSDYDGIVDPINSFWTVEQYPALKSYLERHAFNYMQNEASVRLKYSFNKIGSDTVIQNVFQTNAWEFFRKWF